MWKAIMENAKPPEVMWTIMDVPPSQEKFDGEGEKYPVSKAEEINYARMNVHPSISSILL